jgi:MFS family permease
VTIFSFLDRERTVAPPGYSRWLVPPAALAIHLCIGQGYALSVFSLPMSRLLGVTRPAPGDWPLTTTVWMFNVAFFMLGGSAFLWGKWLERVGPRRAMFVAAVCFAGGFFVAAAGVATHVLPLLYGGFALYGVGLGLGYISPVSTLIKWFPDRPGMATGMAIMGFGGGALIGSPLAANLMDYWKTPTSVGVAPTFVTMGALYFAFMMFGVFLVRVPDAKSALVAPGAAPSLTVVTAPSVTADRALRTPQFWLLWAVLYTNVTAGIAVLAQASPMIQEMFQGRVNAKAAAGFVGFISIFNLVGRLAWSSVSDYIGRKRTYAIYFALGAAVYCAIPTIGRGGSIALFVAAFALIFTMYGGGFSTIPAYLRDLFGVAEVGAIHGRLLTAWSLAAITGPTILTYVREYELAHGVATAEAYTVTMYVMAGLLAVGFACNAAVGKVDPRHYSSARETET